MYGVGLLLQNILLIIVMIAIGVILKKTGKINHNLAKDFGSVVIYVSQPAMIIYSFLSVKFSVDILINSALVLGFSFVFHILYYFAAKLLFRSAPEKQKIILRFSVIFSNAGFLGIPLISNLLGNEAAIYATFYVVSFNLFCWSLGCYIFTSDKKYISPKKMLINPASIPTYIGLALFILCGVIKLPGSVLPIFDSFVIPFFKDGVLLMLKQTVIPLSMMMVGIRLSDCKLREVFNDKYIPLNFLMRLIIIPAAVMIIMKLISLSGIIPYEHIKIASYVLVICASTPAASMASIFAERFDGDAVYASKIVSASTFVSMATMTLISSVLELVF